MASLYLASKQSRDLMNEDIRIGKSIFDRTVKNVNFYNRDNSGDINPLGFVPTIKPTTGTEDVYSASVQSANILSLEKSISELTSLINGQISVLQKNPNSFDYTEETKNFNDLTSKMDYLPILHKWNNITDIMSTSINHEHMVDSVLNSTNTIINLLKRNFKEYMFDTTNNILAVGALNLSELGGVYLQKINNYMDSSIDVYASYYDILKKPETPKPDPVTNVTPAKVKNKYYDFYESYVAKILDSYKIQTGKGVNELKRAILKSEFNNRLNIMSNFVHKTLKLTSLYYIIETQIFDTKYSKINMRDFDEYTNRKIVPEYNAVILSALTTMPLRLRSRNLTIISYMFKNETDTLQIRKDAHKASQPINQPINAVEWTKYTGSGKKSIRVGGKKDDKNKPMKLERSFMDYDPDANNLYD